jgi:hypothetical protein
LMEGQMKLLYLLPWYQPVLCKDRSGVAGSTLGTKGAA